MGKGFIFYPRSNFQFECSVYEKTKIRPLLFAIFVTSRIVGRKDLDCRKKQTHEDAHDFEMFMKHCFFIYRRRDSFRLTLEL